MIWIFSSEKTIIFLNAEERIFLDIQRQSKTAAGGAMFGPPNFSKTSLTLGLF